MCKEPSYPRGEGRSKESLLQFIKPFSLLKQWEESILIFVLDLHGLKSLKLSHLFRLPESTPTRLNETLKTKTYDRRENSNVFMPWVLANLLYLFRQLKRRALVSIPHKTNREPQTTWFCIACECLKQSKLNTIIFKKIYDIFFQNGKNIEYRIWFGQPFGFIWSSSLLEL